MTITNKTFRDQVVAYDEASDAAKSWAEAKQGIGQDLAAFMADAKIKTETFEAEDAEGNPANWTVTLVAPESEVIDDEVLTAILKKKRLYAKVYTEVVTTSIVRDDDVLAALIQSGKLSTAEVKKFSSIVPKTRSVRVTKSTTIKKRK